MATAIRAWLISPWPRLSQGLTWADADLQHALMPI